MLNRFDFFCGDGFQRVNVMTDILGELRGPLRHWQLALTQFFLQFGNGGHRFRNGFDRLICFIAERHAPTLLPGKVICR